MRISGQVLVESTAKPLGGAAVRVARRGAGNALLSLTTNTKGEFESELSDDFLGEPVLVITATHEGFLGARLERVPGPVMQVALGLQAERPVRPRPLPAAPPVPPPVPPPPALVTVGWRGRLVRALGPSLFLAVVSIGAFWTLVWTNGNEEFASIMQVMIFIPICAAFLAWRDGSIEKAVRRDLQGKGP